MRKRIRVGMAVLAVSFAVGGEPASAAEVLVRGIELAPRISAILKEKKKIDPEVTKLYRLREGRPFFQALPGKEFALIPLSLMEYQPSEIELQEARRVAPNVLQLRKYYDVPTARLDPKILAELCSKVDRRSSQTSIKDQGGRGTCVAHAALAALEVAYKPLGLDLSENYGYFKFEGSSESEVCADNGLNTLSSGQLMTDHGMSPESCWPYVGTLAGIGCPVPIESAWPTADCGSATKAQYRVTSHQKIYRKDDLADDVGEWINNPKYLESVLCAGHDVVIGVHVAGWPSGQKGVIDAVAGAESTGGHALVLVGFERTSDAADGGGYFIAKNSWGTASGQDGYLYLSYDYIRVWSKYGYYITGVQPVRKLRLPPLNELIRLQRKPGRDGVEGSPQPAGESKGAAIDGGQLKVKPGYVLEPGSGNTVTLRSLDGSGGSLGVESVSCICSGGQGTCSLSSGETTSVCRKVDGSDTCTGTCKFGTVSTNVGGGVLMR